MIGYSKPESEYRLTEEMLGLLVSLLPNWKNRIVLPIFLKPKIVNSERHTKTKPKVLAKLIPYSGRYIQCGSYPFYGLIIKSSGLRYKFLEDVIRIDTCSNKKITAIRLGSQAFANSITKRIRGSHSFSLTVARSVILGRKLQFVKRLINFRQKELNFMNIALFSYQFNRQADPVKIYLGLPCYFVTGQFNSLHPEDVSILINSEPKTILTEGRH